MSDDFEPVLGTGNVFRDLNLPNPELEQLRAAMTVRIAEFMALGRAVQKAVDDLLAEREKQAGQ